MRYLDIICESIPSSPEFQQWFKGSKVVDKQGQPLRMFHGTHGDFQLPLQTFTHFGTAEPADQRLFGKHGATGSWQGPEATLTMRPNARVYPVFLSIKKPYVFTDSGKNSYFEVLRKMGERQRMFPDDPEGGSPKDYAKYIIQKLTELGCDGLKYKNKFEDAGSISWVVFSPEQVGHEFQGEQSSK